MEEGKEDGQAERGVTGPGGQMLQGLHEWLPTTGPTGLSQGGQFSGLSCQSE